MADVECCLKSETPPQPSPRMHASYMERVKHLLANIPSTPSIVRGSVVDDEESLADFSSSTASTRTATGLPSETSTAATSVETLPLIFVVQKFHVSPNMPIDDKIKTVWARQIKSRLTAVLLHGIPTGTCVQELMMVGKKPTAMKPTLVITCGDAETKKRVEKTFKSQSWLQDLLKANGIVFIALVAKTIFSAGPALEPPDKATLYECCAILLDDSRGSSCGHLLRIDGPNMQPQRHCTLGGLIVVNGKVQGLTAGHAFEAFVEHAPAQQEHGVFQDIDLSEDEESSEASSEPFVFNDDDDDNSDDEDLSSVTTESSQGQASACSIPTSSLTYGQNASSTHFTPSITWSQPLDAIIPHSSSYSAQSFDELPGECDWALVDILPRSIRMRPNKIPHTDVLVERTVSGLFDGRVAIIGADIRSGYIHPSPVAMTVDKSVLHVRLITLDRTLPLGSSGAWVTLGDELCGFIIAIRQDVPWAYMMPIEPVIEDIKRKFQTTDVRLPHRGEIESWAISKSSDEPPEKPVAVSSVSNNCSTLPAEHCNHPLEGPQEETLNEKSFIPENQTGLETHVVPAPLSDSCSTKYEPMGSPTDVERSLPPAVDSTLPTANTSSKRASLSPFYKLLLLISLMIRRFWKGFLSGYYYICWVFTTLYGYLLGIPSGFFPNFTHGTGSRNFALDEGMPSSRQIESGEMAERHDARRLTFIHMASNSVDLERYA